MEKTSEHTVLGIVPARGGSKGISRKNIRLLDGEPLLAYTARAAQKSARLSRVLLSTDDAEIAATGKSVGLEVPFVRPSALAQDSTPMIEVVLHAIHWAESQGEHYDAICLLQPTSPLRSAKTIDRCISELWEREADCAISVRPVPLEYNPHWVYMETPEGLLKPSVGGDEPITARQLLPPAYHRDGLVFAARTQSVLAHKSLYGTRTVGVVSPEEEACDLDSQEQWEWLEKRMKAMRNLSSAR
ncbi:MAG: acylneuraminate cytidylyltransferase [Acidobacteria bacterium]|nr:MAG: acylneuraminate cytidylyltransferase [Acidobacteriota bacterium]